MPGVFVWWDRVNRSANSVVDDGGGSDGKVEVIGVSEYTPGPTEETREVVASGISGSTMGSMGPIEEPVVLGAP